MKLIAIVGASAMLLMSTACNMADGAKKDAEIAAEKTADAAAATGDAVSGAAETSQVKTALLADSRVDAGDINVDTNEELKTVTLRGTVKTEAERKIAEEIAVAKAVGYTVTNNLTIKP
ncbi:MAG: BON domain-containing protein [Gemmatimonadaceae bacterium]|nr:BON domain-containing protein [Gemmatimonadaceae bacterium]